MASKKTWHYLIGDIHGCYTELKALEALIYADAKKHQVKPHIVSVGDLIDRGPDSARVLRYFQKGVQKGTHTVVMGNHEYLMLLALRALAPANFKGKALSPLWLELQLQDIKDPSVWLLQGGYQTLKSMGTVPLNPATWNFDEEFMHFILYMPFLWETEECLVTHAWPESSHVRLLREVWDARPGTPEEVNAFKQAIYLSMWKRAKPRQNPDPKKLHVSGHTPIRRIKRFSSINCIQIDTGCVFGGRLTAYCVEDNRSFSVPAAKHYWKEAWAVMQQEINRRKPSKV